jgi:DNA-directed RNA polymerase subunit RPC12/RpoP
MASTGKTLVCSRCAERVAILSHGAFACARCGCRITLSADPQLSTAVPAAARGKPRQHRTRPALAPVTAPRAA